MGGGCDTTISERPSRIDTRIGAPTWRYATAAAIVAVIQASPPDDGRDARFADDEILLQTLDRV
jgi:hypothetical protein